MSKLRLYARLARQSQQKNRQFYLPFMLASAGCAAMFYIMRFLCYSDLGNNVREGFYLIFTLELGCIVIGFTSLGILWYANKFVMRRRQKELGLYNILGMQKGDVACVLGLETVIMAVLSTIAGLLGGILFSKLVLLALAKLVHFDAPFGFSVCVGGLWQTALLMGGIFGILLVYNIWCVARSRPIELLHSDTVGEREPKSRWLLALVGAAALAGGYGIAVTTKDPIVAFSLFFPAVMLVILGTYCLFTAGSVVLLKLLRKNKKFYYQPQNFTAVSGMLYRMKQNAKGLANICILATMVLVTVSCTVCMYSGMEEGLERLYPDEIALRYVCPAETLEQEDFSGLEDAVAQAAAQYGCTSKDITTHLRIAFAAQDTGDGFSLDQGNFSATGGNYVLDFITAEDYGRLTGTQVSLAPDEVMACGLPEGQQTLRVGEYSFRIQKQLSEFPVVCDTFSSQLAQVDYLVVSGRDVLVELYQQQLAAFGEKRASSLVYHIAVNVQGDDANMRACYDAVQAAGQQYLAAAGMDVFQASSSCRAEARGDFYASYGGFLFLGLFLGTLFLLATVLIMYYKQISEGYEDRSRFVILQKVGMSEQEVRASIRRQVLMIFFLPLLVAALHIAFAFPLIVCLFTLFSLSNVPLFAVCTVITFALFALVYVLVYLATARKYYQIVRA
ncbi:MAG: ABC transporter permease [Faecalibacterium sp.]|jgi:putative ABC transport system permease protein|nr:ABC transporter permease [Faecalibacterium sp.]